MIDKDKYVFLLGGHDLEMMEIKNILVGHGLTYYDNNLEWGAKLSSYSEYFNGEKTFVGIELIKDIATPKNYEEIDHHNENSNKPSSIEQIAGLLKIELNNYQKLVAANDRGYIPAMEKMGATKKEIDKIRLEDRLAQDVTIEDEKLAELSIKENLSKVDDIVIVNALTEKHSPIIDKLYPIQKLIICTNFQIDFYGHGASVVAENWQNLIKENKVYSGGGADGFVGTVKGAFDETQISVLKKELIELIKGI